MYTEWALGTIADGVQNLIFKDWRVAVGNNPPAEVNQNMVLHLKTDDIYIDLKFLSWQSNRDVFGGGGGFSSD